MRVKLYPSDQTGCGQYRIMFPAEAAKAQGCDVTLCNSLNENGELAGMPIFRSTRDGGRTWAVRPDIDKLDCDVLVLQRVADMSNVELIPKIQAAGIAVVVEMDDDMTCLPTTHPGVQHMHPKTNPTVNWAHMSEACRLADLVVVSTPALVDTYGKHRRIRVVENRIPERLLQMPRLSDGNTVGWSGYTPTHPGDLRVTNGGVAEAVRNGARYIQIGPATGVKEQLGLDGYPEATGALPDIEDYYMALGRLDVGICPLLDTKFNNAKSWLKPLEMSARGVVPVMSSVREYERFGGLAGVLAKDRGRDWRRQIERLLSDDALRGEMAERGREVASTMTIEGNVHLWVEAWEVALANRRKAQHAKAKHSQCPYHRVAA